MRADCQLSYSNFAENECLPTDDTMEFALFQQLFFFVFFWFDMELFQQLN